MQYAILLQPHANARYQEAVAPLALGELRWMLRALRVDGEAQYRAIAGLDALCFTAETLTEEQITILREHSRLYFLAEMLENDALRPLFSAGNGYLGNDLAHILKYKGKTNESFTHLLVNAALCASDFLRLPPGRCHLLDPMCGRGTTLFDAANRGWQATGIDIDREDIRQAEAFFKRYLEYHRFKHARKDDGLTVSGKKSVARHTYTFANTPEAYKNGGAVDLSLVCGDAAEAARAWRNDTFHFVVADLPYGVQHAPGGADGFEGLLRRALPVWRAKMVPGGAISLSFNTYTLKRDKVRALLAEAGFRVATGEDYDNMEHWVEQAVLRDLAVGVK